MKIDEKMEAIKNLLKQTLWKAAGSFGAGDATFTEDTVTVKDTILNYVLSYDKNRDELTLLLTTLEKQLYSLVKFDSKTFRWVGREAILSKGYVQITPITFHYEWKLYSKLSKIHEDEVKEEQILYVEDIGPDYVLQPYDILKDYPQAVEKNHLPGIALIGCSRIKSFNDTVQALAQNNLFHEFPVYLFLDFPVDKSQHDDRDMYISELKRLCNPIIVARSQSYGCGKNIIDARRQLFDNVGHSRVYVFEDDIVVSSNYIQLMENIWSWAEINYDNIGAIQGWNPSSTIDDACYNSYVQSTFSNWWGYSMSKKCWDDIKENIYTYEKNYLFSKYWERPHRTILTHFFKFFKGVTKTKFCNPYPLTERFLIEYKKYQENPATGQDGATGIYSLGKGWVRLTTTVNRALHLGSTKEGLFDNVVLSDFAADAETVEFNEMVDGVNIIQDKKLSVA